MFSGGDRTWVLYQGPPRWDGEKYVNGDKFFLAGHRVYQCNLGVELARGVGGLELPARDDRYDSAHDTPGSRYVSSIYNKREIDAPINILGDTPAELRENKRRWLRNHPTNHVPLDKRGDIDSFGRLWIFTSDGEPRFLPVLSSVNAGTGALETEPEIFRKYESFDWGWASDSPFFYGYKIEKEMEPSGSIYSATFYNPSTVPEVHFALYLPGNATWEISLGYKQGTFVTPPIGSGEIAKMDFTPSKNTFTKRRLDGSVANLWNTMIGTRPKYSLEPETKNTFSIKLVSGSPESLPKISFRPRFMSWN